MHLVLDGIPHEIIDDRPVAFRCKCSQEKVISIVAALNNEDIEKSVESRGSLEITCNFCNQVYNFTPEGIAQIKGL